MNINKVKEILDKTNIYVLDETDIIEYIGELEQVKEDYIKSLNKLDVLEARIDKDRLVSEREDLLASCLYQDKIIKKAIDKLYCWGEVLNADFQKEMLDILRGEDNEEN